MFCTARRGSLISLVLMLCSRFCVRTSWLRCWNCTAGCSTAFTFMMMDAKPTSALASRLRPNGRPRLASSSPSAPPRRLLHFFAFLLAMASFHSRDSRVVAPLLWDLPRAARGTQFFDLCRYKSTHVCSTIRLGIDEMKLTSLVDKESRKRSSTLREKKKKDNWEGVHWISGTVQSEEHGDADADVGAGGKAVVGCRKASHEGRHDHHLEVCLRQQNTSWTRRRGGEGGLSSSGVLEHRLRPRSSNRFPAPSSRKKLRVPRPQRVHPGGPQRDR